MDLEVYHNHIVLYGIRNMVPIAIVMDPEGLTPPLHLVGIILRRGCSL